MVKKYRMLTGVRRVSSNLLDPVAITYNRTISTGGVETKSNTLCVSDYMQITAGTDYKIVNADETICNYVDRVVFFDASQIAVGSVLLPVSEFTAPAGSYYMRAVFIQQGLNARNIGVIKATDEFEPFVAYSKRPANPIYKDDVTIDYELESQQRFYRKKLNGKITFVGSDYEYIMAQDFEEEMYFFIERSTDFGLTWSDYYTARFSRTDCTVNEDNKAITVSPQPLDDYSAVLAGIENEYNLVKIAPAVERVAITKRPLVQIYGLGDEILTCLLRGLSWEQDVSASNDPSDIYNDYHFAIDTVAMEIKLSGGVLSEAHGLYTGNLSHSDAIYDRNLSGKLYCADNSTYYIEVTQRAIPAVVMYTAFVIQLKLQADDSVIAEYGDYTTEQRPLWQEGEYELTGNAGTLTAETYTYIMFARLLLDVKEILDIETYQIGENDISGDNRNYHRYTGYAFNAMLLSTDYSEEPTEWGQAPNGKYYLPPQGLLVGKCYPVARSLWHEASLWFRYSVYDDVLDVDGRKSYTFNTAYSVGNCINVLLRQFAPEVRHEEKPEFSEFLYGTANTAEQTKFRLLCTQKTNILAGENSQPAQNAPATLQDFLNMLKACFQCYWHIENGKLRIEHISWYRNGGSYSGTPQLSEDLTQIENTRNGKKWAFATSEYSFDKSDLASRFEFSWMDECTGPFNGNAIEVTSKLVQEGKKEDISVQNFTSDIDYMMLNPSGIAEDGFALMATVTADALLERASCVTDANGGYTQKLKLDSALVGNNAILTVFATGGADFQVKFYDEEEETYLAGDDTFHTADGTEQEINIYIPYNATHIAFRIVGATYAQTSIYPRSLIIPSVQQLPFVGHAWEGAMLSLQNGLLAFCSLQEKYYLDDMPAKRLKINGVEYTAHSIQRKKKQNVTYPVTDAEDIDPMKLVRTNIGDGAIDKISFNISSETTKTTLKYDTY